MDGSSINAIYNSALTQHDLGMHAQALAGMVQVPELAAHEQPHMQPVRHAIPTANRVAFVAHSPAFCRSFVAYSLHNRVAHSLGILSLIHCQL